TPRLRENVERSSHIQQLHVRKGEHVDIHDCAPVASHPMTGVRNLQCWPKLTGHSNCRTAVGEQQKFVHRRCRRSDEGQLKLQFVPGRETKRLAEISLSLAESDSLRQLQPYNAPLT